MAVNQLADIERIFARKHLSFLPSGELVAELRRIAESP